MRGSIITILVLPLCMMIKFFVEHFMMRTEFFFGIMQRVVEPNPYLGQTRDAASVFSSSNIQKCRVRLECLPMGWLEMLQKSTYHSLGENILMEATKWFPIPYFLFPFFNSYVLALANRC